MNAKVNPEDVLVIINHPHGKIEITLQEWMLRGPGERNLLQPVGVKSRTTGETMPINTIPFAYRNNTFSRFLIKIGVLSSPWRAQNGKFP